MLLNYMYIPLQLTFALGLPLQTDVNFYPSLKVHVLVAVSTSLIPRNTVVSLGMRLM